MSTDRLMATSFRFEQNKGNAGSKRHDQEVKIAVNYIFYYIFF